MRARLVAVVLVAVVAIAAWLAGPLWRGDSSSEEGARIPASEALTRVVRETLSRAPRDEDTVRWDSRLFGTAELRTALESSPEGQRVGAIRQAYLKVLLRDPLPGDCDGLRQWVVRRVFREVLRRDPAWWDAGAFTTHPNYFSYRGRLLRLRTSGGHGRGCYCRHHRSMRPGCLSYG